MKQVLPLLSLFALIVLQIRCSSAPGTYKTQAYAKLATSKTFEEGYSVVWQAVKTAMNQYKILQASAENGLLVTDWIYSTSKTRYLEYRVNGFPRKKFLQTRFKFDIVARRQMGGVYVEVKTTEENETLKPDGSFDRWRKADEVDTSRAHQILKSIERKILSRPV